MAINLQMGLCITMEIQDAQLRIMTGAVAVSAAALIAMAVLVVGCLRTLLSLRDQVRAVLPPIRTLLATVSSIACENEANLRQVEGSTAAVFDHLSTLIGKINRLVSEVSMRATAQMERMQIIGADIVEGVQSTANQVSLAVRPFQAIATMAGELAYWAKLWVKRI